MEFTSLNELNRLRHLDTVAPWSTSGPFLSSGSVSGLLSPRVLAAARDRAHLERALAFRAAFRPLSRTLKRLASAVGRSTLTKPARGAARARSSQ